MLKLFFTFGFFILTTLNIYSIDYYWIGGSGKWSELNHWATTSGGFVNHGGAPNDNDNVYFDSNSFTAENQVIEIDVASAYCKNMDWTQVRFNPLITGKSKLYIYGNFLLAEQMNFDFDGELYLESSFQSWQFQTHHKLLPCNLYFNGSHATWQIDVLNVAQYLNFNGSTSQWTFQDTVNVGKRVNFSSTQSKVFYKDVFIVGDTVWYSTSDFKADFAKKVKIGSTFDMSYTGCEAVFHDSINVGSINVAAGLFNSNNHPIVCGSFSSYSDIPRTVIIDISEIWTAAWSISNQNLNLILGKNTIHFSGAGEIGINMGESVAYNNIYFEEEKAIYTLNANNCTFKNITSVAYILNFAANTNYCENATLNGNAIFGGNYTFDYLTLGAGYQYIFNKATVQTINNQLIANGNCKNRIILKTNTETDKATIKQISGTVTIDYAIIKNMNATGSTTYTATNSADLGNNTGFNINSPSSQNLYWVENSGNWADVAHWSFTSGGAGGACIPSPFDNVFFDSNSFNVAQPKVTVNSEHIFCHSMNWTDASNSPVFDNILGFRYLDLNIFGSLTLNKNMDFAFDGKINFESTNAGNTILTNGITIKTDILFKGINGEWTLLDSLINESSIYLNNGTLNTNKKNMKCFDFETISHDADRKLDITNSKITIAHKWTLESSNLIFESTLSLIVMTSELATMNSGDNAIYYDVDVTDENGAGDIKGLGCTFHHVDFHGTGTIKDKQNTFDKVTFFQQGFISESDNYLKEAIFLHDGFITRSTKYGTLTLSRTRTYTFNYGDIQTIENEIVTNSSCTGYIYLQSSLLNSQAYFFKENGKIDINYVIMRDIGTKNNANATFTAHNSLDFGNNIGWIINPSTPRNVYWIGDTGNWNDTEHWSNTSGGMGGACVPTPVDNAIFDNNSFSLPNQAVSITENAYCNDITWNNATNLPTFKASGEITLFVYGSLIFTKNMKLEFRSDISFQAITTGKIINFAAFTLEHNAFFDGKGGEWTLLDEFNVSGVIYLNYGTLKTNNQNVSCNSFQSQTSDPSVLDLGSSIMQISGQWNTSSNFKLLSDKSLIQFSGGAASMINLSAVKCNFYDIQFIGTLGSMYIKQRTGVYSTFHSVTFNKGSLNAFGDTILSLSFNEDANVSGNNYIEKAIFKKNCEITGNNIFGLALFDSLATIYGNHYFKKAIMNENGNIFGENTFETLKLSPDKTYTLESGKKQTIVDTLDAQGNNCFKLQIQSSSSGNKAEIYKASGTVSGYALRLKDITATGNATFYAGGESQNILNTSSNWIFNNQPGYIYGLPSDSVYIDGTVAIIPTLHFNGNNNTTFQWFDNTVSNTYSALRPQKIWVKAIYAQSPLCYYSDTMNIYFAKIKNTTCFGGADGSIELLTDQKVDYKILWSNGLEQEKINNLKPDIYNVSIIELMNNLKTTHSFPITQPKQMKAAIVKTGNISCFGGNDGWAIADAQGNTAPYKFNWDDGANSQNDKAINLSANKYYHVTITDANNCPSIRDSVLLNETPEMKASINITQSISCNGISDGAANVTVTGGNVPYIFSWSNKENSTNSIANHLSANTLYEVTVSDSKNCPTIKQNIVLTEPEKMKAVISVVTPINCFGESNGAVNIKVTGGTAPYQFLWNDDLSCIKSEIYNLKAGKYYKIKVVDANKCPAYNDSVLLSQPQALLGIYTTTPASCPENADGMASVKVNGGTEPYSYKWNNNGITASVSDLKAGIYSVEITDANKCKSIINDVLINSSQSLKVESLEKTNVSTCYGENNGKIAIIASSSYEILNYKLNNELTVIDGIFDNLPAGKYDIAIEDQKHCSISTSVQISQPDKLNVVLIEKTPSCNGQNNGSLDIVINGGTKSYFIDIWNEKSIKIDSLVNLLPTTYKIEVTDSKGCSTSNYITIQSVECASDIFVPNIFSPNGDGINDEFRVTAQQISNFNAQIYNRWGVKIYEWNNINNGWNGMISNNKAASGVYFYLIHATGFDNKPYFLKGTVEIVY